TLLLKVMDGIADGSVSPLPYRVFPFDQAVQAFRFMAKARHIGKIIVTRPALMLQRTSNPIFRPNASYLITGGFGGLGLVLARWMAENGARHLVLVGRSEPSMTARTAIKAIDELGTQVMIAQVDVAVAEQMADVFHRIEEFGLPPLRGVFHLAGVLDNGVLLQQDWSRFSSVLEPKVNGTWHLHTLTKNLSLDFFVMFSSVASLIGSRGQGNHAAANMFMDSLAHYRRAEGLPALSLNWGAWSETGAAAKKDTLAWVAEQGMGTINSEVGLQVMEELFHEPSSQIGIAPINWSSFLRGVNASGAVPSFFTDVIYRAPIKQASVEIPQQKHAELFFTKLKDAPVNKRRPLLITYIQEQTRKVLGLEAGQDVYEHVPLSELGLDSLMAVELRNVLSAGLGLKRTLPATLVFDYPTVEAISNYLMAEMDLADGKHQDEPTPAERKEVDVEAQMLPAILDTLEALSDDEAEEMFAKQMTRENGKHE
ncbi:MAG: SDR family NAD(P)-dependent oxidoreductase, partial [Anaerolineales bacterium]